MAMKDVVKFVVIGLIAFCAGCAGPGGVSIRGAGNDSSSPTELRTLRVGVVAGRPPLAYRNSLGEPMGSEVNLVMRFCEKAGMKCELGEYEKEDLFIALRRGDIDIAVPAAAESEIAPKFLSPCARHSHTGWRLVANAGIAPFITDLKQIDNQNVRVYTVAGTVSAEFARGFFKSADVASLETLEQCVDKVLRDNGCVLLTDETTANCLLKKYNDARSSIAKNTGSVKNAGKKVSAADAARCPAPALALVLGRLSDEPLAWAVRSADSELMKKLDDFEKELRNVREHPIFEHKENSIFHVRGNSSELTNSVFSVVPEQ